MGTPPRWSKKSLFAGVLGLGVAIVLLATYGERFRRRPSEPPPEVAAEIRALREDVARMRLMVERQREERAAFLARGLLAAAPSSSEPPPSDRQVPDSPVAPAARALSREDVEDVREQQAETRARYFGFLNTTLTSEPRDSAWATATEQKMKSVLSEADFAGNSVREVECRRTLCKIVVGSVDRMAIQGLLTFATRMPELPNATYRRTPGEGGAVVTTAYFSKQGEVLPPAPKELLADTSAR